jgi:hypothetical protein
MPRRWLTLAIGLAACWGGGGQADSVREAEDAVRAFYTAIDVGDCDGVKRTSAKSLHETFGDSCGDLFAEFAENEARVEKILRAAPDGRRPDKILVHAELAHGDKVNETVTVAAKEDGHWVVSGI